ncbi:IS66 family insertion sequence element accessory protein TnpB [Burkholderia vietnamiensis]|uniref:IS66 family insertion sequence element accessory protein TnpB n=1 Tax=Burkholderia vietnamiensis TaxID=60552 RepID=UPI0018DBCC86|nr:IS66 family insertion sequence element accessory protein TnpB [Burkholderia vietnamiensis]MBR8008848.1 IS66 family insertion sequence element accessory protein TnpB [Burkholderia vietnamiensis]HDR8982658.1 IS66 family insertion sequence element accessory protein TnpB [Burkholderia vietnamiensis]HDR9000947.1 IS66 family insertion sequence element accessory protein TnpB [Burkholderia vietnamiensis]HDR9073622.1 IS66 family insertion sequence element accessory protein TnpB [Burkholderia vietnami
MLPVIVNESCQPPMAFEVPTATDNIPSGSIQIQHGKTSIRIEGAPPLPRCAAFCSRSHFTMICLPQNTRIYIAAGVTDIRCGFNSLAAKVQTVLEKDPFSGHVFVFWGKCGDLQKCLCWSDGVAKRARNGTLC